MPFYRIELNEQNKIEKVLKLIASSTKIEFCSECSYAYPLVSSDATREAKAFP